MPSCSHQGSGNVFPLAQQQSDGAVGGIKEEGAPAEADAVGGKRVRGIDSLFPQERRKLRNHRLAVPGAGG
jgi:hypothetical protein